VRTRVCVYKKEHFCLQGAVKDGSAPDGTSYVDAAEKEEIKQLLK
jgi:hypothetical protein